MTQVRELDHEDLSDSFEGIETLEQFLEAVEPLSVNCAWAGQGGPGHWSAEPSSPYATYQWRYRECRAALAAGAKLMTAEDAGRRILNFRNPTGDTSIGASRTLLHAYQLVMPGERAPSHRHTAHALRVILESKDMYSVVNGEKTLMETGDVVLTPGMTWHSHEHNGEEPAYWIDGLDVPLVSALQVQTFEPHPDQYETVETVVEDSPMRFSHEAIQHSLDKTETDPEGYFGRRIQLNAETMPTLGLYVYRLESGQRTRRYRTNASTSFASMQGSGTSIIDGEEIHWEHGDIFIVPAWRWIEHRPNEDCQLFSMTDEPLMKFARYYRFEGANP